MRGPNEDNWDGYRQYLRRDIAWRTANPESAAHIGYSAVVDGKTWDVRLNDFPDEPMFTLIVSGLTVIHFNEWPDQWRTRPIKPVGHRR